MSDFPIQPVGSRVVVLPKPLAEKTTGGIWIPESADTIAQASVKAGRTRSLEGTVVAVGPGKWHGDVFVPTRLKPGDEVFYGSFSGMPVINEEDGQTYFILTEAEISLVRRPAHEPA
jgi:chaperonin GroES